MRKAVYYTITPSPVRPTSRSMSVFIKFISASRVSKMLSRTGMMTSTSDGGQTSQMAKASVIWVISYQDRKYTAQCKFRAYIWAFDQLYKKCENARHPFNYLETRTSHNRLRPEKLTGVSCASNLAPWPITLANTYEKMSLCRGSGSYAIERLCLTPLSGFALIRRESASTTSSRISASRCESGRW
jgi:hypothetical protein